MKYIHTFEKFTDWLPFIKKKPIDTVKSIEEPTIETTEEPVVEIPVSWTSAYDYKGKRYMLEIGDYTNKGIITDIIEDIHPTYITSEGGFFPDDLTVFKGNPEDIELLFTATKYNI
jgi:hypothetical protein